jgi:hypothetical protein
MTNNVHYERHNLMNSVEVSKDDASTESYLDYFSPKYYTLLDNIGNSVPYGNNAPIKITTLSQKQYQTSSLWWIISSYNGYLNPLGIGTGNILDMPVKSDIDEIFKDVPVNKQGTSVTI